LSHNVYYGKFDIIIVYQLVMHLNMIFLIQMKIASRTLFPLGLARTKAYPLSSILGNFGFQISDFWSYLFKKSGSEIEK